MFEIDGAWQIRGGNLQSLLLLRQVSETRGAQATTSNAATASTQRFPTRFKSFTPSFSRNTSLFDAFHERLLHDKIEYDQRQNRQQRAAQANGFV